MFSIFLNCWVVLDSTIASDSSLSLYFWDIFATFLVLLTDVNVSSGLLTSHKCARLMDSRANHWESHFSYLWVEFVSEKCRWTSIKDFKGLVQGFQGILGIFLVFYSRRVPLSLGPKTTGNDGTDVRWTITKNMFSAILGVFFISLLFQVILKNLNTHVSHHERYQSHWLLPRHWFIFIKLFKLCERRLWLNYFAMLYHLPVLLL